MKSHQQKNMMHVTSTRTRTKRKTYSGGYGARRGAEEHSSCGSDELELKFHVDVHFDFRSKL
eukprot:scaffold36676_cov240-Skeletonema_marinoi.AAC.6